MGVGAMVVLTGVVTPSITSVLILAVRKDR
jgi:hypothetical protein